MNTKNKYSLIDSLVVSDEWENFLYILNTELAELVDKDVFAAIKNTLAVTYINFVAQALQRGGDPEHQHLIAELRSSIMTYEGLRLFLQTLKFVTLAARAGCIPEFYNIAGRIMDGGEDGGKKSGEVRRKKSAPTHDAWQAAADKIWEKHPTWGKPQVAKRIAEKSGGNPDTIRKTIRKPLP